MSRNNIVLYFFSSNAITLDISLLTMTKLKIFFGFVINKMEFLTTSIYARNTEVSCTELTNSDLETIWLDNDAEYILKYFKQNNIESCLLVEIDDNAIFYLPINANEFIYSYAFCKDDVVEKVSKFMKKQAFKNANVDFKYLANIIQCIQNNNSN